MVPKLGQARKDEHLDICLDAPVEAPAVSSLFEHVHLVHDALPELSVDEVELSTTVLGKALDFPLVILGMTGGTERARQINRDLALAAQRRRVAFGVGSQRAMADDPSLATTFAVRDVAPDALLFGNIGAQQLATLGVDRVRDLVDRLGADAIFVHLNAAQELAQPEGDRDFRGCLSAIARLCGALGEKVWVKETGCGLSPSVARKLIGAGVGGLDISGAGGTSFTRVESLRATGARRVLGETFSGWGIPTAAAVASCADLGVPLVASGGLRTGLDLAKALALGATLGGMALPLLRAQAVGGPEGAEAALAEVELGLRAAMLLTGSRSIADLRRKPRVLTGDLPRWVEILEERRVPAGRGAESV